MSDKQARILRIAAIVLMGLTAAMNLVGGIGTVCAAFLTRDFPPLWDLLDYQWLYQPLMIVTILIGIVGAWVTFVLFRGKERAYRNALIILGVGTVVGAVHFGASLAIRGTATPANVKFFINLGALVFFLGFRLPGVRERVDFSQPGDKTDMTAAGGFTAIIVGITLLTIMFWAGPSHAYEGMNWIARLQTPLNIIGVILTVGGIVALAKAVTKIWRLPEQENAQVLMSETRH